MPHEIHVLSQFTTITIIRRRRRYGDNWKKMMKYPIKSYFVIAYVPHPTPCVENVHVRIAVSLEQRPFNTV